MSKIIIDLFQDTVNEDGTIDSGPLVNSFEVESLDSVADFLAESIPGNWQACAGGKDGCFENSDGAFGTCLVSNPRVLEHTPGPWNIVDHGSKSRPSIDIQNGTGITIAQLGAGTANARLIAAAPQMFVALQKVLMQIQDQKLQDRFGLSLSHIETSLAAAQNKQNKA